MPKTVIGRLRWIGLYEAVSFLVLLGIAMPLKYFAGRPEAVSVVGSIHGGLFMLFCLALFAAARRHDWPLTRIVFVLGAALVPCGPFMIDARLRREDRAYQAAPAAA